jgi:hypothetical protein
MESPNLEQRRDERLPTELAVDLGGTSGITRNVSASGMYFETSLPYAVGSEIDFSVDLDTPRGKLALKCRGEIVRVTPQGGKVGVAVKIIASAMESGE